MKPTKTILMALAGLISLLGSSSSAMAILPLVKPVPLSDSQEPGSVIVFPKFISGVVTIDGEVITPKTEFEIGVVCPKGQVCPENQKVKIKFHYVCGVSPANAPANSFICRETEFQLTTIVNAKLVF